MYSEKSIIGLMQQNRSFIGVRMKINMFAVISLILWVVGSAIIIFSTNGNIISLLAGGIFYLSGYIERSGEVFK